jgi:4-hydroxybenzoate polyprenyltransferase
MYFQDSIGISGRIFSPFLIAFLIAEEESSILGASISLFLDDFQIVLELLSVFLGYTYNAYLFRISS